ncbi:hypothetical protein HNY73_018143 [Argiope bruennichi]|uniref:Uncharacterized protein n=1 Tax=Argiope bruennichi TaxID=94029 RepID=A0A8T0ED06_ARGBR|nr:hypothetical protein HNY73_018143 [Argiope bruennichi]KAF8770639.1 hypothetical protein HNY73_018143 [Argiope bruennichi]
MWDISTTPVSSVHQAFIKIGPDEHLGTDEHEGRIHEGHILCDELFFVEFCERVIGSDGRCDPDFDETA